MEHNPTVTLDAKGGIIPNTASWINSQDNETSEKGYQANSTYGNLPIPTRNGYSFLGWRGSTLPSEYQEVEYIESTGTQWINTGIKATNKTMIKAKLYTTNTGVSKSWFGGSINSSHSFIFQAYGSNRYHYQYGTSGSWPTTNIQDTIVGIEFDVEYGNGSIKINELKTEDLPITSFYDSTNLAIFAINGGSYPIDGRVYYFKIFEDDNLIRNFVPCYRKSDNVIGLYDTINGVFYTNQGTGTFGKGSNVGTVITSSTKVITNEDHTLYAIWKKDE